MSRFAVAAVRLAKAFPSVALVVAFSLLSPASLFAATTTAAPQLLPYTVTAVAGGGTYGSSAGYYNNGTDTSCTYQAWSSSQSKYVATVDSNFTPSDTVGDGCLATEVLLISPRSAVADSEGNVFFIDSGNNLIRRIDAHTGVVTTVGGATIAQTSLTLPTTTTIASQNKCPSGNTQNDPYGDGCLATDVPMFSPEALALDVHGNIWFTDYYLGAVREIVKSTGVIQTVVNQSISVNPGVTGNGFTWTAGTGYVGYNANNITNNPATSGSYVTAAKALLFRPYGLAFDAAGNLYIADDYNNVVDMVNLGSTAITYAGYTVYPDEVFTIAGTGCPARWDTYKLGESVSSTSSPTQVNMSCDSSGFYGHSNGTSPFPSTGTLASPVTIDSPYQVSVDNSGNIYIADEYPYNVRVINGATDDISTFAGIPNSGRSATAAVVRGLATSTKLSSVYGVAADSLGNVYIADYASTTDYIERVDIATGELYPIAGQISTAAPTTADIAPAGASYCAASSGVTPFMPGYTDDVGDGCPGLKASFWKAYFPSVDAAGNLYVGDASNGLIRKLSSGTEFPSAAVGTPVIQYIDVHFGAGDTPAASNAYSLPTGFADFAVSQTTTPGCTLNSADTTTDCLLQVTFTPARAGIRTAPLTVTGKGGLVSTFSLTGTGLAPMLAVDPGTQSTALAGLSFISGIALDDAGNIYASVPGSSSISELYAGGNGQTYSLTGANAIAVDASGNIYAALSSGSVVKLPPTLASQTTIGSGFSNPSGIAVDSFGNVYVADAAANSVSEILAGTGVQIVLASETTVPSLSGPTGVAVDSYGNVFVANTVNNDIIEVPFNGSAPLTLGSGLSSPIGLAVDPAGSLYIADSKNQRIVFIPNENGALSTDDQIAIITGLGTPTGVAIAGNGSIFVSDSYSNAIYYYDRSSAAINFGNTTLAVGTVSAGTLTAGADIISMGTAPAVFSSTFASENPLNDEDFSLSPSSIPVSSYFPDAGYGVELTASFSPTGSTPGTRSATYTFGATDVAAPALALSGTASHPSETATTTITSTPPSGQVDWIYGQTVAVNVTVISNNLAAQETPTGNVTLTVDGTQYTVALSPTSNYSAAGTQNLVALSAGPHNITAAYGGDSNFGTNNAAPINPTLDQAPLTVTGGTLNKPFDAPLPTLTGTLSGVQNGDQIGVSYTTTAQWTSPVIPAGYPIIPSVTGSALDNYSVTYVNGTLNVTPDSTATALGASATSVNPTTQVTLTATVSNQTAYANGSIPTGTVTFFNGNTQIGNPAQLNSSGVATLVTSFAVIGQSTNNVVTALYSGDPNFQVSTSAGLTVVSGVPTFGLTAATTNSSLTVEPGQSGLTSFTLAPAYGYDGTISFTCTGSPSPVTCSFSPSTVVANASGAGTLVAVTINTTPPVTSVSSNKQPAGMNGSGKFPLTLAAIPGLALMFGFSARHRRFLRGYRSLLLAALCLIGFGLSGCAGGSFKAGTPAGADTITIVATGSGGSFAGATQQFTVTLNVQ